MHEKSPHQGLAFVVGVEGSIITGHTTAPVGLYDQVFVALEDSERKRTLRKICGEIIGVTGSQFSARIFEDSKDIKVGQAIELTHEPIINRMSPSMLGGVFDGFLQCYKTLLSMHGPYLKRGTIMPETNTDHTSTALRARGDARALKDVGQPFHTSIDALYPLTEGGSRGISAKKPILKTAFASVFTNSTFDVVVVALCGARHREIDELIESLKQQSMPDGSPRLDSCVIIAGLASMPPSMQDLCVLSATNVAKYFQDQGCRVLLVINELNHWLHALGPTSSSTSTKLAHLFGRAGMGASPEAGSLTIVATLTSEHDNAHDEHRKVISPHVGCLISFDMKSCLDPHTSWSRYKNARDIHDEFDEAKIVSSIKKILIRAQHLEQLVDIIPEDDLSIDDLVALKKARLVGSILFGHHGWHGISKAALATKLSLVETIINYQIKTSSKPELCTTFAALSDMAKER